MSDVEAEPPVWKTEYAKSGRAKCRKCKINIEANTCRVGKEFDLGGHRTTHWYHVFCMPVPRKGLPESDIQGLTGMAAKDQAAIRTQLLNPRKTKRKSSASKKSDGRASKKICRLPVGWRNSSVQELKPLLAAHNLPVSGKKDVLVARLEKMEEVLNTLDPAIEKIERKKFQEYEEGYGGMTGKEMKKILRLNGQKMGGKKAEMIERCSDGKLYGALPKCEECGGGRLQVIYPFPFGHKGQGRWLCKGYYDDGDYVPCFFRSEDPQERKKWLDEEEEEEES